MRGLMNDAIKTQISAFIDGELPENESELLLRRLSQDASLRQQVSRYLEIGRLMRQDREVSGMDSCVAALRRHSVTSLQSRMTNRKSSVRL